MKLGHGSRDLLFKIGAPATWFFVIYKKTYSRVSHLVLPWMKEPRVKIDWGKSCAVLGEGLQK
jgi:hypothetical protein